MKDNMFDLAQKNKTQKRMSNLMTTFFNIFVGRSESDLLTINAWISVFLYIYMITDTYQSIIMIIVSSIIFLTIWLIVVIDFKYMIILDETIIILLFVGFLTTIIFDSDNLSNKLICGAIVYGCIEALAYAYYIYRGIQGIGEGDAKLLSVSALLIGSHGLPICLLYSTLSALISVLLVKYDSEEINMRKKVPFGSYLAFGIWIVFVTGDF